MRRSVAAIGRCAIRIQSAAERAVAVLLELIKGKVNYVVQEAIVALKVGCLSEHGQAPTDGGFPSCFQDIFRKYPHAYESIIPSLCESIEALDEPESKASLIWMIGEYAELVDDAHALLANFLHNFKEESAQVRRAVVWVLFACLVLTMHSSSIGSTPTSHRRRETFPQETLSNPRYRAICVANCLSDS